MEAELANKGFHWVAGRASVERSHQLRINFASTMRMFGLESQISVGNPQTLGLVASQLTASRLAKFVSEGALTVESTYAPNWLI